MHFSSWKVKVTRRGIQIALGCLWLLDGLLQLQPQMFTANFVNNVIAPAAQGQPGWVSAPMHFFIRIFLLQPALFNSFSAIVQLALGLLILWKRTTKIGLIASVGWGLFVWYIGEGLSGLASWHTMLLMGAPGAALIYVLLALGTLTPRPSRKSTVDQRPAYWLLIVWALLWTLGSVYQLLPGQNTIINDSAMISTNANSAPNWLASLDKSAAAKLDSLGNSAPPTTMEGMSMSQSMGPLSMTPAQAAAGQWFLLLVVMLQIATGLAVFVPGPIRTAAVLLGCILAATYWVLGQSLGSYYSGVATDPNTGPLLVLLGIAVLGCTQRDELVRHYIADIKRSIASEFTAFNDPDLR